MSTVKKIELGVSVAGIGLAIAVALHLVSYGRGEATQDSEIRQLKVDVTKALSNAERIPVIENDVKYLRKNSDDMNQQIKILIERK